MPRFSRPSPRIERLVAMLRAGNYLDVACRAAELDLELVDRLLKSDGEVGRRIGQASAEGEVRAVTQIAQAGATNWQAAAWLLERQYPERWSRPLARDTDDAAPVVLTDSLDELARRRDTRRAGVE